MIGWLLAAGLGLAASLVPDCPGDPVVTAGDRFEAMLSGGGPEAELGFAECLVALDLPHAAQRHALEVVRRGRGSPAWNRAVDVSMALVDVLGDPLSPMPYLQGIQPADVSAGAGRDALYLVHGQLLLAEQRYELAAVRLEEVDPTGVWGAEARLSQGRAMALSGRMEPALDLFLSVPDGTEGLEARVRAVRLLQDLGRTDEALAALEGVEGGGLAVPEALRVALLLEDDRLEEAAEAVAAVRRAARDGAWIPEADLVVAELAWRQCRVGKARRHLDRFDGWSAPVALALDTAVHVGSTDGRQVYADWFGPDPVDHALPPSLEASVRQPLPSRARVEGHLAQVKRERARLPTLSDGRFQAVVAPHLERVFDDGEERLRFLVGEGVAERLRELHADLEAHQATSAALRESLRACL